MKKTLAIILTVLMLFSVCSVAFAADEGIASFAVNPYGKAADSADTVNWYKSGSNYFMFLPAGVNLTTAIVYFTAGGNVTLDGQTLSNGGSAAALTEGAHTLACGGSRYNLTVLASANIPAVYITTESGSLDYIHSNKENKEPGTIRIYDGETVLLNSALKQIKGRGNATWTAPKKPYNIKFDKKTSLFGMPKAKKWTLLANYYDESLMRNVYGWEIANRFGLYYSSEYKHVDLYINGEYLGNYVICESVEIGDNRVEINDLEKANENANPDLDIETLPQKGTGSGGAVPSGWTKNSAKWIDMPAAPEDISGGYLLEYEIADRYNAELCGFVTENGQPVVVKEPEHACESEVRYIAAIVNDATNALYSPDGYNSKGRHYSEYFDMDSFVNMYLIQELSANLDGGYTSTYLFKAESDDKLYFSPVWDFDHAFGDEYARFQVNIGDPSVWWANGIGYSKPLVFAAAFAHDDFKAAVRSRWAEITDRQLIDDALRYARGLSPMLVSSGAMNIIRWNASSVTSSSAAVSRYNSGFNKGDSFVSDRVGWLTKGFAQDAAYIRYNANGGSGYNFNSQILSAGEKATLIGTSRSETAINAPSGYTFAGWNTKADGTGTTYQPGDKVVVSAGTTTFYAVWSDGQNTDDPGNTDPGADDPGNTDDPGDSGKTSFWDKIVAFFKRVFKAIKEFFLL